MRRSELFRLLIFGIKSEIGEADGFVIRVRKARAKLPMVVVRDLENAIVITVVTGGLRCGDADAGDTPLGDRNEPA